MPEKGQIADQNIDPRVACIANPDKECPARAFILKTFGSVPPEQAGNLPDYAQPSHDGLKVSARLIEHTGQVAARGCTEPELSPEKSAETGKDEYVCPPRVAMDNSPIRRTFVEWLRITSITKGLFRGSN